MAPNYESDELESGSEDESVEEEVAVVTKKRSKKAWKVRAVNRRRGCCHFLIVSSNPFVTFGSMSGPEQTEARYEWFFLVLAGEPHTCQGGEPRGYVW